MASGLVWGLWPLRAAGLGSVRFVMEQNGRDGLGPASTWTSGLGWQGHFLVLEMYLVGNPLPFSSGTSFLLPDSSWRQCACALLGEAAPQPCVWCFAPRALQLLMLCVAPLVPVLLVFTKPESGGWRSCCPNTQTRLPRICMSFWPLQCRHATIKYSRLENKCSSISVPGDFFFFPCELVLSNTLLFKMSCE